MKDDKKIDDSSFWISLGFCLIILAFFSGDIKFWFLHGPIVFNAFRFSVVPGLLCILFGLWKSGFSLGNVSISPNGFAAGLWPLLLTDWMSYSYSLYYGPSIKGLILLAGGILLLIKPEVRARFWSYYLIIGCIGLIVEFLLISQGNPIFSDDHGPVMYRLALLKAQFPKIPFYNPFWNAGTEARDFFATGVLNVFTIFWPLIRFFDIEKIYNLIVMGTVFLLLPASCYWAARIEGFSKTSATISSLLAISSSLVWYRWVFKYGSMGFVCSVTLIPLTFAFVNKVLLDDKDLSFKEVILFFAVSSLMLFWSASGLVFVPFIFFASIRAFKVLKRKGVRSYLMIMLAFNLPWILLFLSVSKVDRFLTLKTPTVQNRDAGLAEAPRKVSMPSIAPGAVAEQRVKHSPQDALSLGKLKRDLRGFASMVNPLLILFFLPAILVLAKSRRYSYLSMTVWLAFLGLIVSRLKPQLELERMLVVLTIITTLPVGNFIIKSFEDRRRGFLNLPLYGFVFSSFFSVSFVLNNRSMERFVFANSTYYELCSQLNQHTGKGRALFTGFVLHELDHGHLAPLGQCSRTPLVASSPVHDLWWYSELVPAAYINRGREGIEEFFDLYNAGLILSHERKWDKYLEGWPERYRLLWKGGRFKLFERIGHESDYFHSGSGEITEQAYDSIKIKLHSPEAVLKYRYFNFLEASNCKLAPFVVDPNLSLIKISGCKEGVITSSILKAIS